MAPVPGAMNVDISPACGADVVHDLRAFPWPFPDGVFSRVRAIDVLEHLPDTVASMEEIHRVCRSGALVEIVVPHFSCANAFTDPTHCHQFGFFSFDYFTDDAPHGHYTHVRFRTHRRELIFLPSRKNALTRRIANRWPGFYERHLCWIFPAWFMGFELEVVK
jgi:SAM-dependent methyltransferase